MEKTFNKSATDRESTVPLSTLANLTLTVDPAPPSRLSQGSKMGHNKSMSIGSRASKMKDSRALYNTLTPTNNDKTVINSSSKKAPFSRAVRVSSNPADMEAKRQLKCLIKNKIDHLNFDPSLCSGQWK